QRYAERFHETLSLREDFQLALKAAAQAQKWSAETAQELAQRYEDDSAFIQRYPLISGFVRGSRNFGWEFNPRLRIVTRKRFILPSRPKPMYWMEPGAHHCYALVAVNDGRIEAGKTLLMTSEEDLKNIALGEKVGLTDLHGLKRMYEDVLKQTPEGPDKVILEETLQRLFTQALNEKDEEKLSECVAFHRHILDLCGRHGRDGIKKLELRVSRCHWFNLHNGKKVEVGGGEVLGTSNPMIIELPDKLDRTLEKIWPVRPNWGLTDQETTVTIKGENFSTDARVFVGGIEVEPKKVSVVGKNFIVATFPKIDNELLEGDTEKKFAVKVITGGDSLFARDAFTYKKPKTKKGPS
ncbi:MAG: IPT/TIG domain-containing protein, partial [Candidatus Brocadiales bacterium]